MLERHDIKADPQFKAACVASKMDAEKTRESIISKAATQGLAVSLNGKGEVEVKQAVEATVATTKQNVAQAFNAERIAVNRAHTPNKPVVATPAKDTPALSLDIRGLDLAHMQQEGSLGPRTTPQKLADAMIAFTTNKTWPEPKKQDSSLPITLTPDAPGAGKTPEVGVVVK